MQIDKYLYDTRAEIIKRIGSGVSGRIYFFARSIRPLVREDLMELQKRLGYHPAGYDFFFDGMNTDNCDKSKSYYWSCSTSCD